MTKFILFTTTLLLTYLSLLIIGTPSDYQLYAVIAIFGNIALWLALESANKKDKQSVQVFTQPQIESTKRYVILLIQFLLVAFSLFNLFLVTGKTDFAAVNESLKLNFKTFTNYTSIPLVIGAQFGGWFFQTILIFLFLEIMNVQLKFKFVLRTTGVAYLGFLFAAVITAVLNLFYLNESDYKLEEIQTMLSNSVLHIMIAKSGDFLTSIFIAIGIYNATKLNFIKSIMASFIPTGALIGIILIFKYLF